MTRLPTGQSRGIAFRLPAVLIHVLSCQSLTGSEDSPVTYSVVTSDKGVGIDLTTHPHLVERLKIIVNISQLLYIRTGLEQGRYYCHLPFYRQNLHLHSISLTPAISVEW